MSRRSFIWTFFLLIIGLAAFQLISKLTQDPNGVLQTVLTMVVVSSVFYILYVLFRNKNSTSSYTKAVRQSKRKYAKSNFTPLKKQAPSKNVSSMKKKRNTTHLTVIEGKKNKKKDRASF